MMYKYINTHNRECTATLLSDGTCFSCEDCQTASAISFSTALTPQTEDTCLQEQSQGTTPTTTQ